MSVLNKVKSWAEEKRGSARYVAGDTNVTYEDIIKVCELAKAESPKPTAKTSTQNKKVQDVDKELDNSDSA